jgi:hypothetical protein
MWVIFRKSDNEVVGVSADSEIDLAKDVALQEVVRGLVGSTNPNDYDAFQVKGHDNVSQVKARLFQPQGRAKVQTAKGGTNLEVAQDASESGKILVTTNATQLHPVDQVPLIPGDGTSFLVVTLQKVSEQVNQQGNQQGNQGKQTAFAAAGGTDTKSDAKSTDVIWLRTSHGFLREDKDSNPQEIRSLTLADGTGRFRFYSEKAKRLATIEMLPENRQLQAGGLRVELI